MANLAEQQQSKLERDVRLWSVEVTLGYLAQVTPTEAFTPEQIVSRAKTLARYVTTGE